MGGIGISLSVRACSATYAPICSMNSGLPSAAAWIRSRAGRCQPVGDRQGAHERGTVGPTERFQHDRGRIDLAAAPDGALSSSSGRARQSKTTAVSCVQLAR